MKLRKQIITGAMVVAIGVASVTSVYAKSTKDETSTLVSSVNVSTKDNIEICSAQPITDSQSQFTFKEFSKQFKANISKADQKKAKELFEKASKYSEDASKYHEELYKLDLFDETIFINYETDVIDEAESINIEATDINVTEIIGDDTTVTMDFEVTFKDYARDFKKDLKAEVKQKAKKLFDKAMKLEKQNKYEEATKVWEEFFNLDLYKESIKDNITDLDSEFGQETNVTEVYTYTFEDFSKDFKKDLKADLIKKAKALFEKAMELDLKAMKLWDELYGMDIYVTDNTIIDINIK
jgi:tetratricopeptide (TPR) repeat protein